MSVAPKVSVIVPTRDRPALLRRCLASALTQVDVSVEVIVVDDGSELPVTLDADPSIVLIRTENQGAAAARNTGLAVARGDYVLFLDSDDWLEADAISTLLRAIEESGAAAAFGAWRNVDATTCDHSVVPLVTPYADGLANAVAGGWVTGSFLMPRAGAARFETSLKVWEITTFLCDSLAARGVIATCDTVVVNIAQHTDPRRVSIQHDHFEPLVTAQAFAAMKARLSARGCLNDDRIAALDAKLLACLHLLVRAGRGEAGDVYGSVDWARIALQPTYRPGSFAWCTRWGGLAGARGFITMHRAIDSLAGLAGAAAA